MTRPNLLITASTAAGCMDAVSKLVNVAKAAAGLVGEAQHHDANLGDSVESTQDFAL